MKKLKLILTTAIVLVLVVFCLQNVETVNVKFLTYQLSVPRVLLIGIVYFLGMASGMLLFRIPKVQLR